MHRLLSVLLTLVMVLGLVPALVTKVLAIQNNTLYLEVGDNAFDTREVQSIIIREAFGHELWQQHGHLYARSGQPGELIRRQRREDRGPGPDPAH